MSCGYEGRHFGAPYPDATCIDGELWDLDSCDEPGGGLTSGGDIPCPCCSTKEYVEWLDPRASGNARQRRKNFRLVMRRVKMWAKPCRLAPRHEGGV